MSTAREAVDLAKSEAEFQAEVVELAEAQGWRCYHTFDSRRSDPGFPDLVLVRGVVLVFLEIKSAKGRVEPEQKGWIGDLKRVKIVDADIVRPSDWDQIVAILTARAR